MKCSFNKIQNLDVLVYWVRSNMNNFFITRQNDAKNRSLRHPLGTFINIIRHNSLNIYHTTLNLESLNKIVVEWNEYFARQIYALTVFKDRVILVKWEQFLMRSFSSLVWWKECIQTFELGRKNAKCLVGRLQRVSFAW